MTDSLQQTQLKQNFDQERNYEYQTVQYTAFERVNDEMLGNYLSLTAVLHRVSSE